MDQHVVEWDQQLLADGVHTNRWRQDIVREVTRDEQKRECRAKGLVDEPIDWSRPEWQPTPETEWGRAAIHSQKVMQEHNAKVAAQRPFDLVILVGLIAGFLALGLWGAARKQEEARSAPPRPKSQLMHCAALPTYKNQAECLEKSGIELDDRDDPSAESRRR